MAKVAPSSGTDPCEDTSIVTKFTCEEASTNTVTCEWSSGGDSSGSGQNSFGSGQNSGGKKGCDYKLDSTVYSAPDNKDYSSDTAKVPWLDLMNMFASNADASLGCEVDTCVLKAKGCTNDYTGSHLSIETLTVKAKLNSPKEWSEEVCVKCADN